MPEDRILKENTKKTKAKDEEEFTLNYIAHIHQAHISNTSLLGNFLGDFVKGSHLQHLPEHIAQGVRLHRQIDSFTDNHEIVQSLRQVFPRHLRRMSGIVIDIYFDHCLCRHWPAFNDTEIEDLLTQFYNELYEQELSINGRFSQVKAGLLKHTWLINYQEFETCLRAFNNIENRLKGKISFAKDAEAFIVQNKETLENAFLNFYPELTDYVKKHPLAL